MELYFRQLARKLDQERPFWRTDTVILIDGARYHQTTGTFKLFEEL